MLKQVLISGCDVERCLKCEMGNGDHSQFGNDVQEKSVRIPWFVCACIVIMLNLLTFFCCIRHKGVGRKISRGERKKKPKT